MSNLVVLDLDGTVYPWQEVAYEQIKDDHQDMGMSFEELFSTGFEKMPLQYHMNLNNNPLLYEVMIPDPKLITMLHRLSKNWEFIYRSARPESMLRITQRYLRKNDFPNHKDLKLFNNSAEKIMDIRITNPEYCVDDRADLVNKLCHFTKTILINRPYNYRTIVNDSVIRIKSILDLESVLL